MKVGVIGAGSVGAASISGMVRDGGLITEIVVLNRTARVAAGLAEDMQLAAALNTAIRVTAGDYADLADADLVIITAGVNELKGGATNPDDPRGRRVLIPANAAVYAEIVPQITAVTQTAPILVVTDPPDPLAELARALAPNQPVISAGTVIDSLRFRMQIANQLGIHARDVDAYVIGEHGTSAVYLWSSATAGGVPVLELFERDGGDVGARKAAIQKAVKYGNISIIEGIGASQHGIGAVTAQISAAILGDERAVLPVAIHNPDYQTTVGLPSILGAKGVEQTMVPAMSDSERQEFDASVQILREAGREALEEGGKSGGSAGGADAGSASPAS